MKIVIFLMFVAVLVGAIVFVTYKYQNPCYQRAQYCVSYTPSPAVLVNSPIYKTTNTSNKGQNSAYEMQWWNILIAWPEGITAWAIIGTLFVIGWQSWFARQTLLATFRPKIVVRRIRIQPGTVISERGVPETPWTVVFDITNSREGRAKIMSYNFAIDRLPKEPRVFDVAEKRTIPFVLASGQTKTDKIEIGKELTSTLRHLAGSEGLAQGWQGTDQIYF